MENGIPKTQFLGKAASLRFAYGMALNLAIREPGHHGDNQSAGVMENRNPVLEFRYPNPVL